MTEVSGIVRSPDGAPIQGVLVMGVDLNYAETDSEGRFRLKRPEMALFFWCTGFRPQAYLLTNRQQRLEMVLCPIATMRTRA